MMRRLSKRLGTRGRVIAAGIALAALTAAVIAGWANHPGSAPALEQWVRIEPALLNQELGLVGRIEPHQVVTLGAPFEGEIQELRVTPGQHVAAGDVLLRMGTAQIDRQLREATAARLKAQQAHQTVANWQSDTQVLRARRALRTADMALAAVQGKLRETERLSRRGLIPRQELEDLQQQVQRQELDRASTEDDLKQLLKQGSREFVQVAELELENATASYEALETMLKGREIVAPFDGVVMQAAAEAGSEATVIRGGGKVTAGQALLGLANLERLKIVSQASELDINRFSPGQRVRIQGDGFAQTLEGQVDEVGRVAIADDDPGASARFRVTFTLDTPLPEPVQAVRLGMSSRLTVVTYHNPEAMIVPPQALQQVEGRMMVEYREAVGRPTALQEVTLGQAAPAGVEVFGLRPGLVKLVHEG